MPVSFPDGDKGIFSIPNRHCYSPEGIVVKDVGNVLSLKGTSKIQWSLKDSRRNSLQHLGLLEPAAAADAIFRGALNSKKF